MQSSEGRGVLSVARPSRRKPPRPLGKAVGVVLWEGRATQGASRAWGAVRNSPSAATILAYDGRRRMHSHDRLANSRSAVHSSRLADGFPPSTEIECFNSVVADTSGYGLHRDQLKDGHLLRFGEKLQ